MRDNAFTYIELLITLAIVAVLFIPAMQLFSHSLYSTSLSQELITATNLAKWEMERIKNLNFSKEQLKKLGNAIYPASSEPPLEMNRLKWRIEREIIKESNPLEVRVKVFREGEPNKPLIVLVTLIEDMTWIERSPIK